MVLLLFIGSLFALGHHLFYLSLAAYCWLTPLVVILTSETLSVVASVWTESTLCLAVRTLNFAHEETMNKRQFYVINDRFQWSLSEWNSTFYDYEKSIIGDNFTKNEFDYYFNPSPLADFVSTKSIYQRQVVSRINASTEICSRNWNCSYVVSFIAPGRKCEELASGMGSSVKKLGDSEVPFDISDIVPEGNYTYRAIIDEGEYDAQQAYCDPTIPSCRPPYPKNLGAFRTEPIIWIGYATVNDTSLRQPWSRTEPDWNDVFTPVIFGCEHYEINYTVKFEHAGGTQSYMILDRKYLRKVVNTTYVPGKKDPVKKLVYRTKAIPEENYVLPSDLHNYRRTAAYHSLGHSFRSFLNGTIGRFNPNYNRTGQILAETLRMTFLMTQPSYLLVKDLPRAVEKMYEGILITLLSEPSLRLVSWASNGKSAGDVLGGPETSYPCIRQRPSNIFRYSMTQLLVVYLVSLALAMAGVLAGFQAAREEGVMRDMKPSSIIEAIRAPSLNELGSGDRLQKSNVKVGYGIVQHHDGESMRSFGLEGSVVQRPGSA